MLSLRLNCKCRKSTRQLKSQEKEVEMKILFVSFALIFSVAAFADARFPHPHPPRPGPVFPPSDPGISTSKYSGYWAQNKYLSIVSEEQPEFGGFYKVERSPDALEQTVCRRRGQPAIFECFYQRSLNGAPIPLYTPRHRHLG